MSNLTVTKRSRIRRFLEKKTRGFGSFLYKNRKPILLVTGNGLIYLVFKNSFVAYAVDKNIAEFTSVADQLTGESPIKKRPRTYLGMTKEVGMSALGLKIYWDPTATPVQKASAAGRLVCCTSAIVLGAAAELYPPATYGKFILVSCCAASWNIYLGLTAIDAKNLFFGNKK